MATASHRNPIHLVLDWDGTLTKKDTMSFIADFAHQRDLRKHGVRLDDYTRDWETFAHSYLEDYKQHVLKYDADRSEKGYTPKMESERLASLQPVEEASMMRVMDSRFLEGLTREDVNAAAMKAVKDGKLELRKGWYELFKRVVTRDVDKHIALPTSRATIGKVSILSVNWSATFIRLALKNSRTSREIFHENDRDIHTYLTNMEILANDLEGLDDPNGSPGTFRDKPSVRTSDDKACYLPTTGNKVVYIGDSSTDFDCLLNADVAITIRDDPMESGQQSLKETFERMNIETRHVSECEKSSNFRGVWWAGDFEEVLMFLDLRFDNET